MALSQDAVPLIVLSSCLAGNPVRYDGTDKRDVDLLAALEFARLVPLCPEVGIGLGVPRPSIRLVATDGAIRVRGVEDASLDVTDRLTTWGEAQLPLLRSCDGVVLKSRSPSCGVERVPVLQGDGAVDEVGTGRFATLVRQHFPELPLADERQLQDRQRLASFIARVQAHFEKREGRQGG